MLRYKEIKNMLIDLLQDYGNDEKLPSRPHLCKLFDTTRTTLDKAIGELRDEGLIYSFNGSGTFKTSLTGNEKLEVKTQVLNWGIIVSDITCRIFYELVRGVQNRANAHDINIIVCSSDEDVKKQDEYVYRLIKSGVNGLIIVPVVSNPINESAKLYNQLLAANIPFVFCNRAVGGIAAPVIKSNDFYGGYIATKHLIEHGYRNIAYISRYKYSTSVERCQGYMAALTESNIPINRKLIYIEGEEADINVRSYNSMVKIFESGQPIDAVFCFNDDCASGVIRAIEDNDLKISDDIGIMSYDDTEMCEVHEPKITSVKHQSLAIGETAANVLWKMTQGIELNSFDIYLEQPEITVRGSCLGKKKL
ncbi:MAG: substrate-binding domain-containing protein [Clostridia bacterium]